MKAYIISFKLRYHNITLEIGKTYTVDQINVESGHFIVWEKMQKAFDHRDVFYTDFSDDVIEIEVLGNVKKSDHIYYYTDKFKVLRIVPPDEHKFFELDKNSNLIRYQKSNGYWEEFDYDLNNNCINQISSDGVFIKQKYDFNSNRIYFEHSCGNTETSIYNSSNKLIRRESKNETYYTSGIWDERWDEWEYDSNNNPVYYKNSDGHWNKKKYDDNNNVIRGDYSDGHWYIDEYNSDGKISKYEHSNGDWTRWFYNEHGDKIRLEKSDGFWITYDYDDKKRMIKEENSTGFFMKWEYDSDVILPSEYMISNGDRSDYVSWYKYKYDKNHSVIEYEDFNGIKYQITVE
jgi:hypothetical protein